MPAQRLRFIPLRFGNGLVTLDWALQIDPVRESTKSERNRQRPVPNQRKDQDGLELLSGTEWLEGIRFAGAKESTEVQE